MIKESDLYPPIKFFFEELGYEVYGEVNSLDVVAKKDDTLIAIELKKSLNTKLIYQGITRQKLTDTVYLAIPKTKNTNKDNKGFKEKLDILKRLGLGLFIVDFSYDEPFALIELEPSLVNIKSLQSKNKKHLHSLIKEINSRSGDYNKGGTKGKTITAYREKVLKIALFMKDKKIHSPKEIELALDMDKVQPILGRDFYKYFEKVEKGKYKISKKGLEALDEYEYIIKHFPKIKQ